MSQSNDHPTPPPGYTLVKKIGHGGFAEVWKALAPGGFPVALKFVDGVAAEIEQRAIAAMCTLQHDHLLKMHFAQQVQGTFVIGMELCEKNLRQRFNECKAEGMKGIPIDELLGYMGQIAAALDYLNEPRHKDEHGNTVSIQHRDIKPQNIFLSGKSIKVADFGLARAMKDIVEPHSTIAATWEYTAPETFQQVAVVSSTSDQYSLAVTYCELRTGERPFAGRREQVTYAHLMNCEPSLEGLEHHEAPIVARALSKDPQKRWPSCTEFYTQLRDAFLGETSEDVQAGVDTDTIPRQKPALEPNPRWKGVSIDEAETKPSAAFAKADSPTGTTPRKVRVSLADFLLAISAAFVIVFLKNPSPPPPPPPRTTISLAEYCDRSSKPIADAMRRLGVEAVSASSFRDDFDLENTAGAGIREHMIAALQRQGIQASQHDSGYTLSGNYTLTVQQPNEANAVGREAVAELFFTVTDPTGRVVYESGTNSPLPAVNDPISLSILGGLTFVADNPDNIANLIANPKDFPKPHVENNAIRPRSPFMAGVRFFKRAGGEQLPAKLSLEDGCAYLPLQTDEVFQLEVFNEGQEDLAVIVTLDGLNVHSPPQQWNCWLVRSGATHLIPGWGLHEHSPFTLNGPPAQPAADESVRSVTVVFRSAWKQGEAPPADEGADLSSTAADIQLFLAEDTFQQELSDYRVGRIRGSATVRCVRH